jgi:hypothetical protein
MATQGHFPVLEYEKRNSFVMFARRKSWMERRNGSAFVPVTGKQLLANIPT